MNDEVLKAFLDYWQHENDLGQSREELSVRQAYKECRFNDPAKDVWEAIVCIPRWRECFLADDQRQELANDESKSIDTRVKQLSSCYGRYIYLRLHSLVANSNDTYERRRKRFNKAYPQIIDTGYVDEYDSVRPLSLNSELFAVMDKIFIRADARRNIRTTFMAIANEDLTINEACKRAGILRATFQKYVRVMKQRPEFIDYLNRIGVHIDGINELK